MITFIISKRYIRRCFLLTFFQPPSPLLHSDVIMLHVKSSQFFIIIIELFFFRSRCQTIDSCLSRMKSANFQFNFVSIKRRLLSATKKENVVGEKVLFVLLKSLSERLAVVESVRFVCVICMFIISQRFVRSLCAMHLNMVCIIAWLLSLTFIATHRWGSKMMCALSFTYGKGINCVHNVCCCVHTYRCKHYDGA